ncbi:MAG: methylmalonyl Co-A mutase-associated GTPase MeaB, partial [Candidatus Thermoplasmatota archaeon]
MVAAALAARLEAARAGSRRDLARLLTDVEDGRIAAADLGAQRAVGRSIAITGPPGVGKSCFIDHLLRAHAERDEPVALLAVDPSSALSGGALLGDRIRLTSPDDEALARRIYVRSIATRRSSGSIPSVLGDLVKVLHGCGWPLVIIETVGA